MSASRICPTTTEQCYFAKAETDFGRLFIAASATRILAIGYRENWDSLKSALSRRFAFQNLKLVLIPEKNRVIEKLLTELECYHAGKLKAFTTEIQIFGTDFEKSVWKELAKIPYGKTKTYSEVAIRLGKPKAFRAVAAANARNPIAILIPCHRLLGENGNLTGYSGPIATKRRLLEQESGS